MTVKISRDKWNETNGLKTYGIEMVQRDVYSNLEKEKNSDKSLNLHLKN